MTIDLEKYEETTLSKIFAFTLDSAQAKINNTNPSPDLPTVFLSDLAHELQLEADPSSPTPPRLTHDTLERALVSRLSAPPPQHQSIWPVHYLIRCYTKALEEQRSLSYLLKDPTQRDAINNAIILALQLTVSYSGLIMSTPGLFPQSDAATKRGALQLLDSLDAAHSSSMGGGMYDPSSSSSSSSSSGGGGGIPDAITKETQVIPMPAGYLDDFAARFDEEDGDNNNDTSNLKWVVDPIMVVLMKRCSQVSILGNYSLPLSLMTRLFSVKPLAKAIAQSGFWCPKAADGRTLEFQSILGPAFGISGMPDITLHPLSPPMRQPNVATQLFPADPEHARPADVRNAFLTLHSALKNLHRSLHSLVLLMLKNGDTKEAMLNWLAAVLESNIERAKMHPNIKKAATDGFMVNIAAVMLKLSEPFMDPGSGKAWNKLDARYTADVEGSRLKTTAAPGGETRLAADSEAVSNWVASWSSGTTTTTGDGEKIKYHFICECFFMTARSLHLGIRKSIDNLRTMSRNLNHLNEDIEAARTNPATRHQVSLMEGMKRVYKAAMMAAEATLQMDTLLADCLAFYRLIAIYMLRLASGTTSGMDGTTTSSSISPAITLPLPTPPSPDFACLPEYYVEDLCETLIWAVHGPPSNQGILTSGNGMEENMVFFTVFLGAPAHLRNPYLRGKLVEALFHLAPPQERQQRNSRRWGLGGQSNDMMTLFQLHPLVTGHMVKSLIELYVDIEHTDRHNAFYEKFSIRYEIGELASQLWEVPAHREAWRRVASQEERLYIRFINMMINDSQHLLQEALNTLPMVQETERLQADPTAWAALPEQQRTERLSSLSQQQRTLKSDFALAAVCVSLMKFTSEDQAVAARYFDPQVRDRQARILNFFLKYLTVPSERKRLKLKNPEEYGWRPKELIAQLASIHINLYRADPDSWSQAVAADTDYLGTFPTMFQEMIQVLQSLGSLPSQHLADLMQLATSVEAAKLSAAAEEEAWGEDLPEEYEDPLSCRLMQDPVRLPSGTVVDRKTILQHLLTDQRDPFSRAKMSEDDLVEMKELKGEIEVWIKGKREEQQKKKQEQENDDDDDMQE
jgi:ubiquitin conjugation factor E4 B